MNSPVMSLFFSDLPTFDPRDDDVYSAGAAEGMADASEFPVDDEEIPDTGMHVRQDFSCFFQDFSGVLLKCFSSSAHYTVRHQVISRGSIYVFLEVPDAIFSSSCCVSPPACGTAMKFFNKAFELTLWHFLYISKHLSDIPIGT